MRTYFSFPVYFFSLCVLILASFSVEAQGNALDFDGTDDYVEFGQIPYYFGSFTVEGWFSSSDNVSGAAIWNSNSATQPQFLGLVVERTGNSLSVKYRNPPLNAGGLFLPSVNQTVWDGNWHHFAVVKEDNGFISFYIDGILDSQSAAAVPDFDSNLVLNSFISFNSPSSTRHLDGQLDEYRIWNIAKTADQISTSMNCSCTEAGAFDTAGLQACYSFNDAGNPVSDDSGNGFNGSLIGPGGANNLPQSITSTAPIIACVVAPPAPLIPTVSQWGLFILGLMLSALALVFAYKKSKSEFGA